MAGPTVESPVADRGARAAIRDAETSLLLGVGFIPIRPASHAPRADDRPADDRARPPARGPDRRERLEELRRRHDAECPHCTRATGHTRTVFGEGNPEARLMFVGEAPGEEEDRTGRPFVGRAGEKLNDMISAMGLRREDVYIANVLKARPRHNATPTPEESARCGPCLLEQIRIISPEVIVTLGNPATHFLLDTTEGITRMRGRWRERDGIPVMPTYHPAFLLRQYTPENRRKVWSDLQQVMERLGLPAAGADRG